MISDYEFQAPTRLCFASGRALKPGDPFHTVLLEDSGKLVRRDYAEDAWTGPPPDAVAHWCGKVSVADKPRTPAVNDELLLDCFDRLKDSVDPDGLNFRYVVTLLLMRRKRFKFEDVVRDDANRELLLIRDARGRTIHRVLDPRLTDDQVSAVQSEVFRVLGWS